MPGMEYATRLILELCGGEASQPIVAGAVPGPQPPLRFRMQQLERLSGIALHGSVIEGHMRALGFGAEWVEDGVLQLWPPSWRHDVTMEADVVEELVRLHGYDRVPPMPVRRTEAVGHPALSPEQRQRSLARRKLAARGLAEAVTWSFCEPDLARRFGGDRARLRNPINAELSVLRPSGLPNLLSAAARNQSRGLDHHLALFEVGPRFFGAQPGEQEVSAAGIRVGHDHERHWAKAPRPVDAYDARADAQAVLAGCKINPEALRVIAEGPDHYHPGRRGRLMLGPQTVLAEFGELHPAILQAQGIAGRAVGFEVFLDRLPRPKSRPARSRPPLKASPFQPVDRDFAFVVAEEVPAESLLAAVRSRRQGADPRGRAVRRLQRARARRGHEVARGRGPSPGARSHAHRGRDRGRGQEDHRRRRQGHRRRAAQLIGSGPHSPLMPMATLRQSRRAAGCRGGLATSASVPHL